MLVQLLRVFRISRPNHSGTARYGNIVFGLMSNKDRIWITYDALIDLISDFFSFAKSCM